MACDMRSLPKRETDMIMEKIDIIRPARWADYELLDSGDFEKLERFGDYVLSRPEPQALWPRSLSPKEWEQRADAYFRRENQKSGGSGEERGQWSLRPGMPQQWWVNYNYENMALRMRLGLTSFKHVGLFPEQADNWDFIYDQLSRIRPLLGGEAPRVLNLFAYTGGATLAARSAGAAVTHVDSVKPVVFWARENMEASGLDGVRWMVEDALKFARREAKRGNTYHAILLDPPAYGRGPDGERWILEENLGELLALCGQLLEKEHSFLILNLYSMGLSALVARTAARSILGTPSGEQMGELGFADTFGKTLPLGVYYRFLR